MFGFVTVSYTLKKNAWFLQSIKLTLVKHVGPQVLWCMIIQYVLKSSEVNCVCPLFPSASSLPASLYCETLGVACVCVCVCVCVWEEDRLFTCKWLAIIRRSVIRGYVRQLKLCFLTETWFMLLVVTVTTSKRDGNQMQTKAGEINADSVQPLCWYPLSFDQST